MGPYVSAGRVRIVSVIEELLRSAASFSDYLCPGVNPKSTLGHKGNSYHLHVIAEAHCGRGKEYRYFAHSRGTLATHKGGELDCSLADGHLPLTAMASADGRKPIEMSFEAPPGKLQKRFLWMWLVVRYNGFCQEEVGILKETSS